MNYAKLAVCTTALLGVAFMPSTSQAQTEAVELKSLAPSTGTFVPGFMPKRTLYHLRVPYSVASIGFTAEGAVAGSVVAINGRDNAAGLQYPLQPGLNDFEITIKPADKSNYRVKVVRDFAMPNWKQVSPNGPFPIRDSAGELVFNNRMWLLGGYFPEVSSDVWSSANGIDWKQSASVPAKSGINIPLNYVFKNKMWVASNIGELYASADGDKWDLVNEKPAYGKRYAPGGAVFKNRMWVLGGQRGEQRLNDIWSSEDGVNWKQEVENAPWSPRQLFSNVVVKDNKLWVIGGGITNYAPFKGYRDVWVSEDGVNWKEVTDEAPWPGRIWSSCVVYNNRIFLLGGFRAQPVWENLGDVWYSNDGKEWHELKTENVWEARHEHSDYVFDGKLWVVAGNKWPLLNDVWSLEINGLTFLTQPVVQEYAGMRYRYQARADFNKSGQAVQYRSAKLPAWLRLNAQTGVLTGTPPQSGKYDIEIEAFDAAGESTKQSFSIEVTPLPW